MPEALKCPACNGSLELDDASQTTIRCSYCGTSVAVPEHLRPKPATSASRLVDDLMTEQPMVSVVTTYSVNTTQLSRQLPSLLWVIILAAIGIPFILVVSNHPEVQARLGFTDSSAMQAKATSDALETSVAGHILAPVTTPTAPPSATPTPAFAEPVLVVGAIGTGRGQFENPRRLALDNSGRVYVWDLDGQRVQVFDENGVYQTQWSLRQNVRFLLADRMGRLYILGDRLTRHDGTTGELIEQLVIDTPQGTVTQFQAMAFTPQGHLVLSYWDPVNWTDALLLVTTTGELLEFWPGAVTDPYGKDGYAKQLAVDREGNIYAYELDAILKFAPGGRFINRVGGRGSGPGEWSAPQNIATDQNSNLYVGEWRGIHVYDRNGRYLDTISTDAYVMDLAISDNNDLWAIVGEQIVHFTLQR